MVSPMVNPTLDSEAVFCTIRCTSRAHLSPNVMISPAEHDSIRLKTHTLQFAVRTPEPEVGRSSRPRRATYLLNPNAFLRFRFCAVLRFGSDWVQNHLCQSLLSTKNGFRDGVRTAIPAAFR